MRALTGTLSTAIKTADAQEPIARVTLYRTPHGDDLIGPAVAVWRNTESTGSAGPWLGHALGYPGVDPWTDADLILADRGQLAAFWGTARPYGLPPTEPCVIRFEGYFRHPGGVVDLNLVGNGYPVRLRVNVPGGTPGAGAVVVEYNAERNTDQAEGVVYQLAGTAGVFYPLSVEVVLKPGAYGKVALLWKPSTATLWRMADASVLNVRPVAESSIVLPGVVSIGVDDESGKASVLTLTIAPGESPYYAYDPAVDSYGVLRGSSRVLVELGYKTTAGNEYLELGEFYIDDVDRPEAGADTVLSVRLRDSLGKAADELALLYPDVTDYDVAGYTSDDVWLEADAVQRYTAYDSWSFAATVRALLYKSGFSSRQLHAVDGNGADLIVDRGLRLDRDRLYRLRLPQVEKDAALKYAPEPGSRLLDFLLELVETFGYVFGVNGSGEVFLHERDNGTLYAVDDAGLTYAGVWGAKVDAIDAQAGAQRTAAGAASVEVSNTTAAVLRLFFRREVDSTATFTVTIGGVERLVGVSLDYPRAWSWGDGIDPAAGENPSVFELRGIDPGTILVEVTASACFQGLELIEADAELSAVEVRGDRETVENRVTTASVRNDVIVAGAELGAETGEYNLARAVDIASIARPASPRYVGRRRLFILPEPRVTRADQASYIAYRELAKFSTLADASGFVTPGRPDLELGDPVRLFDVQTGEELPGVRFVDQVSHTWKAGELRSTLRVNPYPPLESFRAPLAPLAPPGVLTDFVMRRTDGGSLDPDAYSGTSLTMAQYDIRLDGLYCPGWADESDAVHVELAFNVWRPGFLTLEVKDLKTHKVVAVLAEDRFAEWGRYVYLWSGRWFTADGNSYLYYPQDPGQTDKAWEDYQSTKDPVRGGNVGRAGWVYVEARFDPLDTTSDPEQLVGVNADKPTVSHLHVILGPQAQQVKASLYTAQPVYALHPAIPFGGRYEVHLDEWTPALPRGVRFSIGHLYEPVRFQLAGYFDVHVIVYQGASWLAGVDLHYMPLEYTVESLARGRHLWNVDGTPMLVGGETDFISPKGANGSYEFLFDPIGVAVVPSGSIAAKARHYSAYIKDPRPELPLPSSIAEVNQRLTFRLNYLDFLASLFPGRVVGASFVWGTRIQAYNRAGEAVADAVADVFPYRLESAAYASHKHSVFPPVDVSQGGMMILSGELARGRIAKPNGLPVHHAYSRTVHFTLPAGVSGIDYAYD